MRNGYRRAKASARQLVGQAEALLATAAPFMRADVLKTRAEVELLGGAPGKATGSLRAALQIYEDQRVTALAERARAALASLTAQPGPEPA